MELPTVCIVNDNAKSGFTRINEADFDPAMHKVYGAAELKAEGIPADWQSLHWKQRVALAEKLNGDADLTPEGGQTKTEAADALIAAEVERRGA
jgi:hypothetical protein